MSLVYHERPGVYSSYDASSVIGRGTTERVIALVGKAEAKAGLYRLHSYSEAKEAFGEASELGRMAKIAYQNGAGTVLASPVAADALADYLRRFQPDWVVRYCLAVDLTADEIGVLSNNGVLQEIVPPSTRRLYWQQDAALTLQRIDTRDVRVPVDVMNAALQPRRNGALKGRDAMLVVQVPAWHVGVVKIDG